MGLNWKGALAGLGQGMSSAGGTMVSLGSKMKDKELAQAETLRKENLARRSKASGYKDDRGISVSTGELEDRGSTEGLFNPNQEAERKQIAAAELSDKISKDQQIKDLNNPEYQAVLTKEAHLKQQRENFVALQDMNSPLGIAVAKAKNDRDIFDALAESHAMAKFGPPTDKQVEGAMTYAQGKLPEKEKDVIKAFRALEVELSLPPNSVTAKYFKAHHMQSYYNDLHEARSTGDTLNQELVSVPTREEVQKKLSDDYKVAVGQGRGDEFLDAVKAANPDAAKELNKYLGNRSVKQKVQDAMDAGPDAVEGLLNTLTGIQLRKAKEALGMVAPTEGD